MNIIIFTSIIILSISIVAAIAVFQDENRIKAEADIRRCTMTDCYFNECLGCRSLSDTWNPDLLEYCPDYTED